MQDQPVRKMVMGKRMMMAPSIGSGGGMAAFVPNKAPLLRRRNTSSTAAFLSSSLSADDAFNRGGDQSSLSTSQQPLKLQKKQRVPRPDEPNLYDIPSDLHASYQPMPILLQVGIAIASAAIVGRRSIMQLPASSTPLSQLLSAFAAPLSRRLLNLSVIRKALFFLFRTTVLSTIAKFGIQDVFYPPSRVTTQYLARNGELPSSLSKYEAVTPIAIDDGASIPIGVHSIQYTQQTSKSDSQQINPKYDGISLHHGFGASSLSWLPVVPSLVDRLGSGKAPGVAHDVPGFGFTDRPSADSEGGIEQYTSENNAGIGIALLAEAFANQQQTEIVKEEAGTNADSAKSIAIFGHSMGSKAALIMALHCASHPELRLKPNLVVLAAPALIGVTMPSTSSTSGKQSTTRYNKQNWFRKMASRIWITWRKVFLDYPFRYGLRRLVSGQKDFWRKGLSLAWGDPNKLSGSDVLRFRWPSVGKGWEEGLINFSRSKLFSSSSALSDGELLTKVSNLPNTKVVIMYGSKDNVVRLEGMAAERLQEEYPSIKVVRVEGSGHDPFEEDVNGFLEVLNEALA